MLNYNEWLGKNEHCIRCGALIQKFGKENGYKYGMLMSMGEWVIVYTDGFDWLRDIYTDINHVATIKPGYPSCFAPYNWSYADIWSGEKADVHLVNSARYISIEDLEEELGYEIRITNDDKED